MRLLRRLSIAAAITATLAVAREGHAQITDHPNDTVPASQAQRQLVLPHLTLAPRLDVTVDHLEPGSGGPLSGNGASLEVGAQFGLFGDFEIEAALVSLEMGDFKLTPLFLDDTDGFAWGVTRLGVLGRFFANDVAEIAGRFRFMMDNNGYVGLNFGVPVRVHGGEVVRFDTGATAHVRVPTTVFGGVAVFGLIDVDDDPLRPSPGIPLDLVLSPADVFWLNLGSGLGALDVTKKETIFLPLEAGLGGTIPNGKNAFVDIHANFAFPFFLSPGNTDVLVTHLWQVGVGAKGYLPFKN